MSNPTTGKFSPEVRARAVRMVLDREAEHSSRWAAVVSIAGRICCSAQTVHEWVKKSERENRELRQANEILRKAWPISPRRSSTAGTSHDPLHRAHQAAFGVELICKVQHIAPSTYHANVAKRADPAKVSARLRRDADLKVEITRVFAENFGDYGARKVWRQLRREGFEIVSPVVV